MVVNDAAPDVPHPVDARFDRSPLPQSFADLDLRFTLVNRAMTELLGRSADELVGRHVDEVAAPGEPGTRMRELFATGSAGHLDYERVLVRPDGSTVPVRLVASLMRDEDDVPRAVAATLVDLSAQRAAEKELRGREALHQALLERASDLAVVVSPEGEVLYANVTVTAFGYHPEDVVGADALDFVHPEDRSAVEAALERVQAEPGSSTRLTLRLRHGEGGHRLVETWFTNRIQDPDIGGIVLNIRDVTSREEASRALRESEDRYRAIVETAQEGVWVASPEGVNLYLNQKMADMLGRTVEEVLALTSFDLLDDEQRVVMARRLRDRRVRGISDYELEYSHPDGSTRLHHVRSSPLFDGDQQYVGSLAMVTDVTETRRMADSLRRRALYDELTGLPNRTLLEDRVEQAAERRSRGAAASLTVIVVDVDDFALVNAAFGHPAGDLVLRQVADRLTAVSRPGDTLARFIGDEFVVLAEDVEPAEAHALAQQLLGQLAEPVRVDDRDVYVSASIGMATSRTCPVDELLRSAYAALDVAKSRGHAAIVLADERVEQGSDPMGTAADLRRALVHGELELLYQPIIELRTGRLLGLETLSRWVDPEHGPVAGDAFAEAVERSGLAPQVESWALRSAAEALVHLRHHQHVADDVYVSVDVSARHLTHGDLERAVDNALTASGLPARVLAIELGESALVTETSTGSEVLERVVGRGVSVTLDHFGTGYGSLTHLKRLPLARVKIDSVFVRNLPDSVDDLAMVASVLELARAVRVETVADGVTTAEQADVLARLDCHAGQGALYSTPVDLPTLVERLAHGGELDHDVSVGARRPAPVRAPSAVRASREHGLHRLLALHQSGASLRTIAAALNSEGFRTPAGSRWHPSSVASVIADHAYPSLWTRPRD